MLNIDVSLELCRRRKLAEDTVDRDIHPKDNMHAPGHHVGYLGVGRRALSLVCDVFDTEGRLPHSLLDFPSGWGRASRWFRAGFPDIKIGVGDVWHQAVDHASAQYQATPVYSHENFAAVHLDQKYDCIFSGSLMTHFSEKKTQEFLDWTIRNLTEGGLAIITSHGRRVRKGLITNPPPSAFSSPESAAPVVAAFDAGGFGFSPYNGRAADLMSSMAVSEYGVSLTSPIWWMQNVLNRADVEMANYIEQGWNRHQDVIVLRRVANAL